MKRNIHRDPGTGGEGADVAEAPAGIIDSLDIEAMMNAAPAPKVDDKKTDDKVVDDKKVDDKVEDVKVDDKKVADDKKVDDKKPDDKPAPADETDESGDELPVPELTEDAVEETWVDVANEIGVDAPKATDPVEAFNELKTNISAKLKAEREAGKAEAEALDPNKFGVEERRGLDAFKGGKKLSDLVEVVTPYLEVLSMPSEDFMKLYLTQTLKLPEDKAAEAYAAMEADGSLSVKEAEIRQTLTNAKNNAYNKVLADGENAFKAEQARIEALKTAENTAFAETLFKQKEFMGAKLTDDHLKAIKRNWDAGKYQKQMASDPATAVEFALFKEFGKQRIEKIKADAEKNGKLGIIKKLSNTPGQQAGSKGKPENVVDQNEAAFDPEAMAELLSKARGMEYGRKK